MRPDVNKPVENPKLRALFDELKNADSSRTGQLNEAIAEEIALNANLLAVFNVDAGDIEDTEAGTATLKKDTRISFEYLTAADGTTYLPVYTDWNELKKCEKYRDAEVKTMILSFDDIAAMTAEKGGVAVNPYSDNFAIRPEVAAHMKQHKDIVTKGFSRQTVTEETTVQIGDPAEFPVKLALAISEHAKKDKNIEAIWLKLMKKEGEESYLVIVDFHGNPDPVFKGIGDAASPFLPKGMYIDMVPYVVPFGKRAATGEPLYRRKKGLFRK